MRRSTLLRPVMLSGIGVWSRKPVSVALNPSDSGIRINGIPASIENAFSFDHSTGLRSRHTAVRMVEHLLAACLGWCITDLEALVSGDELPLLDGSSLLYLRAFRQAGRRVLPGSLRPLRLRAPTDVSGPTGTITALPGPRLDATCTIDAPAVPRPQSVSTTVTRSSFCRDIAPARTFGPSRGTTEQVQRSLGLRARLRRWNGLLFPARPRMSSEPCRHKLLDLLGDLCLLGRPLLARVHAFRPGHRLNQELVRAIAQQETP